MSFEKDILYAGKGSDNFPIANMLPVGRENAVSTAELVRMVGCSSPRELQQCIAGERAAGAIICSGSGKGYWRPKNRQEIIDFINVMSARARNTYAATRSAKRALRLPDGQLEIGGE